MAETRTPKWKLVPVEPTLRMLEAVEMAALLHPGNLIRYHEAMLAAAPPPGLDPVTVEACAKIAEEHVHEDDRGNTHRITWFARSTAEAIRSLLNPEGGT